MGLAAPHSYNSHQLRAEIKEKIPIDFENPQNQSEELMNPDES